MKTRLFLFSALAVILMTSIAAAVTSYADWQDGNTAKTILDSESASFNVVLFSMSSSLTYSVNMHDASGQLVKTWHNNTLDDDGWVRETLTVNPSDLNGIGRYTIYITSTDENNDPGYSTLILNVQSTPVVVNNNPVITSVNVPSDITEGDVLSVSFTATDADNDALTYAIYINGVLVSNTNTYDWQTAVGDAGTYTFVFEVSDGTATITQTEIITVNAQEGRKYTETLNLGQDLEISNIYNYIKIRNKARTINDLEVKITFIGLNAFESFNIDLNKNDVVYRPISTAIQDNKAYVAKIEVSTDDLDDSGYMLIKR